jgi:hypothetical protein
MPQITERNILQNNVNELIQAGHAMSTTNADLEASTLLGSSDLSFGVRDVDSERRRKSTFEMGA